MKILLNISLIAWLSLAVVLAMPALCSAEMSRGQVIENQPNGEIVWHYYTYIPEGEVKELVVLCHKSYAQEVDNYNLTKNTAYNFIDSYVWQAKKYGYAMIVAAVPRRADWYGPMLSRATLTNNDAYYQKPNQQLLLMIERFKNNLAEQGIALEGRFMIGGYSAGATFAARMAFLYPKQIKAVFMCGSGMTGWPLTDQRFPVGVSDIQEFGVQPFNVEELKKISFFIQMGDVDNVECLEARCWTPEQRDYILMYIGATNIDRCQFLQNSLFDLGASASFKLYPGQGHFNAQNMIMDAMKFCWDSRRSDKEWD